MMEKVQPCIKRRKKHRRCHKRVLFGISEDLSQGAYQFLMGLYMKFQKYSERDDANPRKDRLSLRTCILTLSDSRYDGLMNEVGTVIEKYQMLNEGGKKRNISIILAPVDV